MPSMADLSLCLLSGLRAKARLPKVSTELAVKGAAKLGLTPRNYRKVISALRENLNIVERAISSGKIETIDYEKVPSKAMSLYKNLFAKKDTERFNAYKAAITSGEAKINASTLYPMDLVKDLLYKGGSEPAIIEAQWKALPNYVSGEQHPCNGGCVWLYGWRSAGGVYRTCDLLRAEE